MQLQRSTCRQCCKPIFWLVTDTGNVLAVDWDECPEGDVVIRPDGKAHTIRGDLWEEQFDGPRYRNHKETCTARKPKKKE